VSGRSESSLVEEFHNPLGPRDQDKNFLRHYWRWWFGARVRGRVGYGVIENDFGQLELGRLGIDTVFAFFRDSVEM
jgi:hypothetical protein